MPKAEEFEAIKNALRERHDTQESANEAGLKALCYVVNNLDLIARALRRDEIIEELDGEYAERFYESAVNAVIWSGGTEAECDDWSIMGKAFLNAFRENVK